MSSIPYLSPTLTCIVMLWFFSMRTRFTLSRYPRTLVYPTLDTLTVSAQKVGIVRAEENLVAGFDWSLRPRWETVPAVDSSTADRVRAAPHALESGAVESVSPAAPGIFAVTAAYFKELGMFDSAMYSTSYSPAETVELSLRAWLCGGMVLKQRCARVAHASKNLFDEAPVGHGVTQASVDEAALNVAQKWLQGVPSSLPGEPVQGNEGVSYQELAFRARFLNRVPYGVELSNDPILVSPPQSILTGSSGKDRGALQNPNLHVCLPFHWYLQEVYPGLLADAPAVLQQFRDFMQTDYLSQQAPLQSLVGEYTKPANEQKPLTVQTGLLTVRASKLEKLAATAIGAGVAGGPLSHLSGVKRRFTEPIGPKALSRQDLLFAHSNHVQEELVCLDFPEKTYSESCEARLVADPQLCVAWKSQGRCGDTDAEYGKISRVCRKSCEVCIPLSAPAGDASSAVKKPISVGDVQKPAPAKPVSDKDAQIAKVEAMIKGPMTVDPGYLHAQYKAGFVPDRVAADGAPVKVNNLCSPIEKPDAQLLSHVKLAHSPEDESQNVDSEGKPLRIFCGIYTMEANHRTNTRATRDTWAKKCDGFIAFSTLDDPAIPAVNILHEGEEAYDNMWQKSRSIWKYVHTHLKDQYDFFLLGGDDMFYIVENLRAYLGSEEITQRRNEGQGLFVGRIFQPPNQVVFNSGGAGYMLDVKALEVLGTNIDTPKCFPHQHGFWEDVNVANCLKKSTPSIVPYDTRDPLKRERFHPFTPGLQLSYRIPLREPDWYAKYNPELKTGFDCCSDESISFHYVKEPLMYRLYNYVYHCDAKMA
eukprot:gene12567-14533_t